MKTPKAPYVCSRIILPCFPILKTTCQKCKSTFFLELGWTVFQEYYEPAYNVNRYVYGKLHFCRACAPTRADMQKMSFSVMSIRWGGGPGFKFPFSIIYGPVYAVFDKK